MIGEVLDLCERKSESETGDCREHSPLVARSYVDVPRILLTSWVNGSFLECSTPTAVEARTSGLIDMTLVKSLHSGDPDVICPV